MGQINSNNNINIAPPSSTLFNNPSPVPKFQCECQLNFDPTTNCVHCMKGFRGPNCALTCSDQVDCSGQGNCIALPNDNQVCDCDWPWTGASCTECGCFNHGTCSKPNVSKTTTTTPVSLIPIPIDGDKCICSHHFQSSTGCATCSRGYFIRRDPIHPFENDVCTACPGGAQNPCNGRGECDQSTGNCTCVKPYKGHACEVSPGSNPSPTPGGNTPIIPAHLIIGTGGLIAVASGACVFGVAAVALVSVLHRKSEEKERAAREKRKKRREYHDSLSVFSAQFSPPAHRVDDDMMRHLLGTERNPRDPREIRETKQRTYSNPEPLFLNNDNFNNNNTTTTTITNNVNVSGSFGHRPIGNLASRSTPVDNGNNQNDFPSFPMATPGTSGTSPSSSVTSPSSSLSTPLLVNSDHFSRPAATLPGLRNQSNELRNEKGGGARNGRNGSNHTTSTSSGSVTHSVITRDRSEESFSSPSTAKEWLVDVNNLIIHEQIGRGGSCLVYRATYDQLRVAVKSLALPSPQDFHSAEEYEYDLQDFRQEAKMLARLRHENIVKFYGIAFTPKTLLLVEEYCPLSLHDLMARPLRDTRNVRRNAWLEHARRTNRQEDTMTRWDLGSFNIKNTGTEHYSPQQQQHNRKERKERKQSDNRDSNNNNNNNFENEDEISWWQSFVPIVAEQVARGMEFLHRTHSIHRDLKPENVLLNERGIFKICDFGVSRQLHPNQNQDGVKSNTTASSSNGFRNGGGVTGGGSNGFNGSGSPISNSTNSRVRGSPVGRLKSVALSITGQIGTPVFMAPEMFDERPTLRDSDSGCAIDVYSYGMLMWAIWSREQPYHRLLLTGEISNPYQIAMRVTQQGLRPTLRFRDHPSMNIPDLPHDIEVLVESCWNADPSGRPTFERILKILGSKGSK